MSIDFDNVENLIFKDEEAADKKAKRSIDLDSIEDHFFGDDTPKIPPIKRKSRSRQAPSKANHR